MTTGCRRRPHDWRFLMMTRVLIVLLSACVGSAVAAAGAVAASTAVKIGVVLPLSGGSAAVGTAAEHGAQLAVQDANSGKLVPGVTFRLVTKSDTDTAGNPNGATGAAEIKGLIGNRQVAGVVAPFDTATALGESPPANRAPLATVSPSATDTCLTVTGVLGCTGDAAELSTVQPTGRTAFFRVAPADALQGAALADFLFNVRHDKTAYVIDDTSPAGAGRATTFGNRWLLDSGSLLGHASVAPTSTSYLNLLTQIAALKPDVIVYTGGSETEAVMLRQQMVQVPALNNTPFAATSSVHTAAFIQAVGNAGGPVWAVAPEPALAQLPSAANFTTQYQAKFGTPSTDAARGYDSAQALLLAVKATIAGGGKPPASAASTATAFRTAVIAALAQTAFAGADGQVAFAPDGDLKQGPVEVDQLGTVAGALSWTPGPVVQVVAPAPAATLTPSALDFGWVATGSSSEQTLHLSNTGTVPFGVGSVSVSGGAFRLAGTHVHNREHPSFGAVRDHGPLRTGCGTQGHRQGHDRRHLRRSAADRDGQRDRREAARAAGRGVCRQRHQQLGPIVQAPAGHKPEPGDHPRRSGHPARRHRRGRAGHVRRPVRRERRLREHHRVPRRR